MGQPLRSITIVGGGTAGWLAAAFLHRFCTSKGAKHNLEITLIESPSIPIVGVGEASLPGMVFLLNQLGVSEAEFFKQTDATFKVAAHFINWNQDDKGRPIEFLHPARSMVANSPTTSSHSTRRAPQRMRASPMCALFRRWQRSSVTIWLRADPARLSSVARLGTHIISTPRNWPRS